MATFEPAALSIRDLRVTLGSGDGRHEVLRGIDLDLVPGRIQGLAGESGSGKTITALTVLGLLPQNARVSGEIRLGETNLVGLPTRRLNSIRGRRIAMVFQDPSSSLHPQITVGNQLTDHVRKHLGYDRKAARDHAISMLERVRVPLPAEALDRYPHQFSGGQRQRIAIAVALACEPGILLADEPTTALDVTVQAGILHLIRDLADEHNLAVLLVTHDLGVMSAVADDVAVMRFGEVVEAGDRVQVFTAPKNDYTKTLLASLPGARVPFDPRALEVPQAAVIPGESGPAAGGLEEGADRAASDAVQAVDIGVVGNADIGVTRDGSGDADGDADGDRVRGAANDTSTAAINDFDGTDA